MLAAAGSSRTGANAHPEGVRACVNSSCSAVPWIARIRARQLAPPYSEHGSRGYTVSGIITWPPGRRLRTATPGRRAYAAGGGAATVAAAGAGTVGTGASAASTSKPPVRSSGEAWSSPKATELLSAGMFAA